MKKHLLIGKKMNSVSTLLFFLISLNSFAQAPTINWQNTIGADQNDFITSVKNTSDGGYITGGYSSSSQSGDKSENSIGMDDYWIVKVDSSGLIEWENTIGGTNIDKCFAVAQTSDGGYIVGGWSNSGISGDKTEPSNGLIDYWIVKLNSTGLIEWQKSIGGDRDDIFQSMVSTSDGGFLLGGYSDSSISEDKSENSIGCLDYWVVKLDSLGNIEWDNTIGGDSCDNLAKVLQTLDGGYILIGDSLSGVFGDKTDPSNGNVDYWVVKLDSDGNIEWQNSVGGSYIDNAKDIIQTSDGGYLLGGASRSDTSGDKTEDSIGYYDIWVVKIDNLGNIVWDNTIGGNSNDSVNSLIETSENNFVIGGWTTSTISGDVTESLNGSEDAWILKLDSSGLIIGQDFLGGDGAEGINEIIKKSNGELLIAANSNSDISGDKTENSNGGLDYWIVNLNSDTLSTTENIDIDTLSVFPNPVESFLNFRNLNSNEVIVQIFSVTGQKIEIISIISNNKIDLSNLTTGVYYLQISTPEGSFINKMIKL